MGFRAQQTMREHLRCEEGEAETSQPRGWGRAEQERSTAAVAASLFARLCFVQIHCRAKGSLRPSIWAEQHAFIAGGTINAAARKSAVLDKA